MNLIKNIRVPRIHSRLLFRQLAVLCLLFTYSQTSLAIRGGDPVSTAPDGNQYNMANYAVLVVAPGTDTPAYDCTGSLIDRQTILTAAHCLANVTTASDITVVFNYHFQSYKGIAASNYKIHESYQPISNVSFTFPGANPGDKIIFNNIPQNDIALIKLSEPAPKEYLTLDLPKNLILQNNMRITAIGYGRTSGLQNNQNSDAGVLRQTTLDLHVDDTSSPEFVFPQFQSGICFGDSGGPAIFRFIGTNYVIGIAKETLQLPNSNPDPCASLAGYTNVQYYVPWIEQTMSAL